MAYYNKYSFDEFELMISTILRRCYYRLKTCSKIIVANTLSYRAYHYLKILYENDLEFVEKINKVYFDLYSFDKSELKKISGYIEKKLI